MEHSLYEYQYFTRSTAIYPGAGTGSVGAKMYCALEAAGEAGEIADKVKKLYRDDNPLAVKDMPKEIGDVLYALARLCDESGISLQDCLDQNVRKLTSRKERGVLQGSGDNR